MKNKVQPYFPIRPSKSKQVPSRRTALKKLAAILEKHMTERGLTEKEKNATTAKLVVFANDVAASELEPHSKHSKRLHSVALQA